MNKGIIWKIKSENIIYRYSDTVLTDREKINARAKDAGFYNMCDVH